MSKRRCQLQTFVFILKEGSASQAYAQFMGMCLIETSLGICEWTSRGALSDRSRALNCHPNFSGM